MAAMDFPSSPTNGQVYGNYVYSTSKGAWQANPVTSEVAVISPTAPSNPKAGDIWYNSDDGCTYVYYYDGDSYQWVASRNDATFSSTLGPRVDTLERGNVNYLLNADFAINQRAFTSTTNTGYGFDRWATYNSGGTTYSAQTFTPGAAPVAGYEGINFARIVTSGQTGTSAYTQFAQKIEDVRTLAGKAVTVSFWAKAASGTPKVSVELQQNFGTGGSPSSSVETYAGQVTLSTSWTRYWLTVSVPSIAGKTIGTTANTSFTQMSLWTSAGTDFNARAGSIGIQSNTFDFWGIQVNDGSSPTLFHRNGNSIAEELSSCQRYYWRNTALNYVSMGTGFSLSATVSNVYVAYPVPMRAVPSSVEFSNLIIGDTASYDLPVSGINQTQYIGATSSRLVVTHAGSAVGYRGCFLSAASGTTGYVGFNAEL